MFLYSAVSSPLDRSRHVTLVFDTMKLSPRLVLFEGMNRECKYTDCRSLLIK